MGENGGEMWEMVSLRFPAAKWPEK
jgi:hypothetical protein